MPEPRELYDLGDIPGLEAPLPDRPILDYALGLVAWAFLYLAALGSLGGVAWVTGFAFAHGSATGYQRAWGEHAGDTE